MDAADGLDGVSAELAARLAAVPLTERAAILRRHAADHPGGRVVLPGVQLNGADLDRDAGGVVVLRLAALRRASLRGGKLAGVVFERADLADSDFAGADLRDADFAGADLSNALLEDADLSDGLFRFAVLQTAILDNAKLPRADLWGVRAAGAVFAGADLRDAIFEEADLAGADLSGADLRGAVLRKAVLRGANLTGANLEGAILAGTDLSGAVLSHARLQAVSLVGCPLTHAHLADAWLERTRLGLDQVGDKVGEEAAGNYELARRAYLALEKNFETLGDPDAASWAYCKKRRMEKRDCRARAWREWTAGRRGSAAKWAVRYANLKFVELLCDYGEGIPRAISSVFTLFLAFVILYGLTGSVNRVYPATDGGEATRSVTRNPLDLATFSLLTMSQLDTAQAGLEPSDPRVYLLRGIQVLMTIFLTGLVGFVVGNRIRK